MDRQIIRDPFARTIEAGKILKVNESATLGDLATGWGTAWRLCLWARMGEGDHAHAIRRVVGANQSHEAMREQLLLENASAFEVGKIADR
jgi:hypothetical protein